MSHSVRREIRLLGEVSRLVPEFDSTGTSNLRMIHAQIDTLRGDWTPEGLGAEFGIGNPIVTACMAAIEWRRNRSKIPVKPPSSAWKLLASLRAK